MQRIYIYTHYPSPSIHAIHQFFSTMRWGRDAGCAIAPHGKEKRLRAEHLHLQQQLKAELSNEAHLQLPALAYVSLSQDWSMGPHAAIESFNLSILRPKHFDLYPFYFYLDLFTLLLSLIILASGIEFWPFAVCTASKFNWSKPCIERKTTPSLQFSRRQVLGKITMLAVSMFKGRILSATGTPQPRSKQLE